MQSRISYGLKTALISCAMGTHWGQFFVFAMGNDFGTSIDDGCHYTPSHSDVSVRVCKQPAFQAMPSTFYVQPPAASTDWLGYLASAGIVLAVTGIGYCMYKMRTLPRRPPVVLSDSESEDSSDEEQSDDVAYNIGPIEAIENIHEQRLREAGFTGEIPDHFVDPVSRSIMVEPVILITDNHTTSQSIEKDAALTLLSNQNPVCPLTRRPFDSFILNRDLKNLIQIWVDKTVTDCKNKNLIELSRDVSKQCMLETQGLFQKRRKVIHPDAQPQKRRRSLSEPIPKCGLR